MGGDEFAIVLARCDEEAAIRVAEKLLATLRRNGTTVRDDRGARVTSSIGIALFRGGDEVTADELVVEADVAMYDAKEAGRDLNFDYLKIDGEFVRNLCATPTDQLVVQAVVSIAHGLGTRTVAEFVGDGATVDLLRELGVDYGQGYHLGRPAQLDQALPYLLGAPASA